MARGNNGVVRALFLALLCVLLPGPSLSGTAQNEPIVFLGDHNFPPYEFLDAGTPRGASVDLLNAIGEVLERPVEIRLMKWPEAQDKVLGGDGHALTIMSKNEKRLALYDFSDGTFNITFSLFVKADMVMAFDAVGLEGRRIGVVKGGFPQAFLEEHQPEAELVFVDTLLDGFNKLFLGQLDAIGSATWVGYHALSVNDISGIQALPRPFAVKIAGISVPKGNEALVREINRALAEMRRSGRFARIMSKWSRHEVVLLERQEIWVFVAIAALASITLASLVVLLWVVRSRKVTRNRAAEVQAANTVLREEIAERKQVEDALRESEQRLSLAVESAKFGTWIRTVPDDVVILDERTEAIFGLEPGAFEGTLDAFLARVHPDDRERIKAGHERLIKAGVPYAIDYRAILPDGSIRHVATRASLIRNDRDSTLQIIGMLHDITERKRVEEALRESEEQLRLITDNVPALIAYVDTNQRYGFINKRYEEWYGISPDEAYGRRVRDVVGEAAYDAVKENLAKALSGERIAFETSLPIKDAGTRHVHVTYVPHHSDDGGVKGVFVLVTDITERKQAEEALSESEEHVRLLLNSTAEAIYGIDLEGNCTFSNPACVAMLGYESVEGLVGKRMHDLIHHTRPDGTPYPAEECRIYQAFRKGEPTHVDDEVLWREDGGSFPAEYWSYPIYRHGQLVGAVVTFLDITERKRLEDELLRRERLATLGQLTATVSHELRNPLGVIRTSAFILRDGLKEEMPRARRALERVERSVMRCDRIIDEMLDFTRMSDLEPEPTVFDEWLAGVLEEQSLPTGISLRQELQLPGTTVALDRDRFRRAVINVFDNACQAMRGEGEAETEPAERVLTVRTRERAGRIEVVFEDRGPGIAPDVYERIFEPLYSTKGFGVGLGLPVVKQIMEQHGGGIEIETEEGRGTVVCLWLDRNAPAEHVAA